jgi:hypothetical protein
MNNDDIAEGISVRYAWVIFQVLDCMEAHLWDQFQHHPAINSMP